jgi:hypothetical protein
MLARHVYGVVISLQQRGFNMSIIAKFNNAIDKGIIKDIFLHIRNYAVSSMILAAGFYEIKHPRKLLLGAKADEVAGFITIVFGIILLLLNLYNGIYKLSKYKQNLLVHGFFLVAYIVITVRIFEIIWHFRSTF